MITETNTINFTALYNDSKTMRYFLRRTWDESKPSATIIMSNSPKVDDITKGDLTSMLIQNNLSAMNYGSVTCVNLFSFMCQKLDLSAKIDHLTDDENTRQILEAVKSTDVTILAIGSLARTYKKAALYQNRLYDQLREYKDKVHVIAAPDGTTGHHPLYSKLREVGSWKLVKFKIPELSSPDKTDAEAGENKETTTSKPKRNNKKGTPLAG